MLKSKIILSPRHFPGLYMILCLTNDYRYYGETSAVSGRIASHKSMLRRQIQINRELQNDWNLYGESFFDFVVLYIGEDWKSKTDRLSMESQLITQSRERCYNVFESYEFRTGDLNSFYKKNTPKK